MSFLERAWAISSELVSHWYVFRVKSAAAICACAASHHVDVITTCQGLYFRKFPDSRAPKIPEQEKIATFDLSDAGGHTFAKQGKFSKTLGFQFFGSAFASVAEVCTEDHPVCAFCLHHGQQWMESRLRFLPGPLVLVLGHVMAIDESVNGILSSASASTLSRAPVLLLRVAPMLPAWA